MNTYFIASPCPEIGIHSQYSTPDSDIPAAVMGPGPLLLGRVSGSLAMGLGSRDPGAWLFEPGGTGSKALGARSWGMRSEAWGHGSGHEGKGS